MTKTRARVNSNTYKIVKIEKKIILLSIKIALKAC